MVTLSAEVMKQASSSHSPKQFPVYKQLNWHVITVEVSYSVNNNISKGVGVGGWASVMGGGLRSLPTFVLVLHLHV